VQRCCLVERRSCVGGTGAPDSKAGGALLPPLLTGGGRCGAFLGVLFGVFLGAFLGVSLSAFLGALFDVLSGLLECASTGPESSSSRSGASMLSITMSVSGCNVAGDSETGVICGDGDRENLGPDDGDRSGDPRRRRFRVARAFA
jgi:hypothetical protein